MATTFSIVELERTQQGSYVEGSKRFSWDTDNRAAPRGQWEYPLELKKVRDENARGEPDIQVLAVAFGDFSLEGVWSDRWGGDGFADRTRQEIEDLVQRATRCRFTLNSISFDGLIDKLVVKYKLDWEIGYKLEITPFGKPEKRQQRQQRSKSLSGPAQMFSRLQTLVAVIKTAANAAPAAVTKLTTRVQVAKLAADLDGKVTAIGEVLAGRVLGNDQKAQNNLERTAAAFRSVAAKSVELVDLFAASKASTLIATTNPLAEASTSGWLRTIVSGAREAQSLSDEAARSLMLRARGATKALYRPRAGESLYAISTQFFGTPHQWRQIAAVNSLYGMTLTGEEWLIIPAASR